MYIGPCGRIFKDKMDEYKIYYQKTKNNWIGWIVVGSKNFQVYIQNL